MRLLAAVAAAALLGGAAHASSSDPGVIVFAADRMPSVSGEIYRVDANGARVNLTRSPYQDTGPLVSPDGKRVAFVSDRAGGGLFVVGVDGQGLRRIAATGLPSQYEVETAWSPDSRLLAYTTGGSANGQTLWLAGTGAGPRKIDHDPDSLAAPSWSPDGRLVTIASRGSVDAFTTAGRHVWDVSSAAMPIGWSSRGLFATGPIAGTIHVYDEQGRPRFSVRGDLGAWSPDGTKLATVGGRRLYVRAANGATVMQTTFPSLDYSVQWIGPSELGFEDVNGGGHGISVPSGRITDVDLGAVGLNTLRTGATFAVRKGTTVYTHVPGCFDDGGPAAAIASLQRVPHSGSIVYQSYCPEAFDNLYSVRPDGTGLRRLTSVQEQQVWPAISPDGTRIAYSQWDRTGLSCKGCPETIWVANVDGSSPQRLTTPADLTYDDKPSWSPDGTTLLYDDSTTTVAPHLLTIPAAGGTVTNIHLPGWIAAWGPSLIAYIDGNTRPAPTLWTVRTDGTEKTKVATGIYLAAPAWSRNGRLAYLDGTTAVVDGGRVKLPFTAVKSLAWSPDGKRLAVVARAKGTASFDVYTLYLDGTDVRRLTSNLDVSSADWR